MRGPKFIEPHNCHVDPPLAAIAPYAHGGVANWTLKPRTELVSRDAADEMWNRIHQKHTTEKVGNIVVPAHVQFLPPSNA